MLHPKGTKDRYLTKSYYELRERGKEKSTLLTDDDWDFSDLEFPDGSGATRTNTFEILSRAKNNLIDIRNNPKCSG